MFFNKSNKETEKKDENMQKIKVSRKLIIIVIEIILLMVCSLIYQKNATVNVAQNDVADTNKENVNTAVTSTENEKENVVRVEKSEISDTGMRFNKTWSELQEKMDQYLTENYKNLAVVTIGDWQQKEDKNGIVQYIVELRRDTKIFSQIIARVETQTNKVISISISYPYNDDISVYGLSEQYVNLKELSKILNVEKEYADFLINILPESGAAFYHENDIYTYFSNDSYFSSIVIEACEEDKMERFYEE